MNKVEFKEIIFPSKKEKIEKKKLSNVEPTQRGKTVKKSPPKKKSEARAYTRNEFNRLGWNVKHPSHKGQLLEEQEAKNFDDRFKELLGLERPDFLIYFENTRILSVLDEQRIFLQKKGNEFVSTHQIQRIFFTWICLL